MGHDAGDRLAGELAQAGRAASRPPAGSRCGPRSRCSSGGGRRCPPGPPTASGRATRPCPCWAATARTVWRYVIWLSAARSAGRVADRQLLLAPARAPGCDSSTVRPWSVSAAMMSWMTGSVDSMPIALKHRLRSTGTKPSSRPVGEEELVLERGVEREALVGRRRDHPLEEAPRVERPRLVVELDHVHDHLAAARGVRAGPRTSPDPERAGSRRPGRTSRPAPGSRGS